jgi:peptidoglycan-associated lipoprotein
MGRGLRSLAGNNRDSRQFDSPDDLKGPNQDHYLPLGDNDMYQPDGEVSEDMGTHPQPQETPGDIGSTLPGIDGFRDPVEVDLASTFQIIHFDTDDFFVRGKENNATIKKIAKYMKSHSNLYIFIEGHCDERASAAYNLSLGARRSNAVREMLIKEGVDVNKLFTISYGKERPLALGHMPQDWQQNRRVQFKLYFK